MQDMDTFENRHADVAAVWTGVLEIVRSEVNEPNFKTWFTQTAPVRFEGSSLSVAVPNEFARDWIDDRYRSLVRSALRQVTGPEAEVAFVVSGSLPDAPTFEEPIVEQASPEPATTRAPRRSEAAFDSGFTFETFVMGNSNQVAYQAALAVAESPGRAYNPLFIYGGVGLGKTHLLQAIGNYAVSHFAHMRVRYVTTEQFVNEFVNSIGDKQRIEGFRQRYRTNDVLLVDDIQFIAKKPETQDAFFHTFNSLREAGRQIVIASDRPPSEIPTLEERLRSRFISGLIVDVQPPDLETRIAILRRKAASDQALRGVEVPDEVLAFIADRVSSNIRELHSALLRVIFYGSLTHKPIDIALGEQVLRDIFPERSARPIAIPTIQQEVCRFYGVSRADLIGNKRSQSIVYPRQVAMYLSRELTDLSLPRIGAEFGGRDHTTVMHATSKIQRLMGEHRDVYDQVQTLAGTIRQKG